MENNFAQIKGSPYDTLGVYGCVPYTIGVDVQIVLRKQYSMKSGRFLSAGQKMTVTVRDGSLVPDAHTARWICTHKDCVKRDWASRQEMIADHPSRDELVAETQAHPYCAILHTDPVPGVDAVLDAKGKVIAEAVLARPGELILMSDETAPKDGYAPKPPPGPQQRPTSYYDGPMRGNAQSR